MSAAAEVVGGGTRSFLANCLQHGLEAEAATVLVQLGRLEELTSWDQETLRDQLGCDLQPAGALSKVELTAAAEHSYEYLRWIIQLATLTERPTSVHCRQVVLGARELFAGAGGRGGRHRLKRCNEAFRLEDGLPFSARGYLRLGEVARAWRVAALNLDGSAIQERARALEALAAPLGARRPHIHPERLGLLGSADASEQLGVGVYREMAMHLATGCQACLQAYEAVQRSSSGSQLPVVTAA